MRAASGYDERQTRKEPAMKTMLQKHSAKLGITFALLLGFALGSVLRPVPASAIDLGDLLEGAVKVGAVSVAIDQFGGQLNDAINDLMNNNDATTNAHTKVVIIVSPIGNKHIGAAQIVGPREAVERVGSVAQLETSFMDKMFRIKGLVPIEGKDANELERVPGVGVSAVIDIKL
jgi:hypothetical protein